MADASDGPMAAMEGVIYGSDRCCEQRRKRLIAEASDGRSDDGWGQRRRRCIWRAAAAMAEASDGSDGWGDP